MPLAPGARLGPYEITALIGEGGMGQVYRAHDTRLKREVALKILPESFATDPERLARFQREAEVLATLNHPNVAAIHGLEESNGVKALVMELVEGPTLADRIASGPVPVDEVLPVAKQIAEALEAAHERGIVHRDLKPANIKVRPDGTVKVLDFGLAKAVEPPSVAGMDATASPTITSPAMTRMGVILGTAAYMSPEQARGKAVDRRADIWAFGVVLFEMLTGRRPFEGDEISDTLASILKSDRRARYRGEHGREKVRHRPGLVRGAQGSSARELMSLQSGTRLGAYEITGTLGAGGMGEVLGAFPRRSDVWILPLYGDRKPFPLAQTEFEETSAMFSPDGRWIAYTSEESGLPNVYVQSFPAASTKYQVSREGGFFPRWRGDGKELFYVGADGMMMAVPIDATGQFEAGEPQALFATGALNNAVFQWAVSQDGKRFLLTAGPRQSSVAPLTVIVNWTATIQN